jgi:hypothetical protein
MMITERGDKKFLIYDGGTIKQLKGTVGSREGKSPIRYETQIQ